MGLFNEWVERKKLNEMGQVPNIQAQYQQAMQMLTQSKFFGGKTPSDINLSKAQLPMIFGQNLPALQQMGIVIRKPIDNGGAMSGSPSYTVVNPAAAKPQAPVASAPKVNWWDQH